jgi:hypothetical protein
MTKKIWMVHLTTWEMRLMWVVDAKEAVRLGDYAYAPVGGTDPPTGMRQPSVPPWKTAA